MSYDGRLLSRTTQHANSKVACPKCGAEPGRRCVTKDGRPFVAACDAHQERVRLTQNENTMKTTDHHYAKIECPTCMAMSGEQCRDPKTLKYLGENPESFHDSRVSIVKARDEELQRRTDESREYTNRALAAGDPRALEFFRRYEKLCEEMGMSLSHEDSHGAFILTDQDTQYNLDWIKSATQKLDPINDQEKLSLQAQYAEKGPQDACARRLLLERLNGVLNAAQVAAKAEGYARIIRAEEFKVMAASIFLDYGDLIEDLAREGL